MHYLLLISLLFSTQISANSICLDDQAEVPVDKFDPKTNTVRIYFPDGHLKEIKKIREKLINSKNNGFYPIKVHAVESLIPKGKCHLDPSTYNDLEKLLKCNQRSAEQRALNVEDLRKSVFEKSEVNKSLKISSEVKYNTEPLCNIYDPDKKKSYYKFQYVDITFKKVSCVAKDKIFSPSDKIIQMKDGKCIDQCWDDKSVRLSNGDECTRYLKIDKPATMIFNPELVPDKLIIKTMNGCAIHKESNQDFGYISNIAKYFITEDTTLLNFTPDLQTTVTYVDTQWPIMEYKCLGMDPFYSTGVPAGIECKEYDLEKSTRYCYVTKGAEAPMDRHSGRCTLQKDYPLKLSVDFKDKLILNLIKKDKFSQPIIKKITNLSGIDATMTIKHNDPFIAKAIAFLIQHEEFKTSLKSKTEEIYKNENPKKRAISWLNNLGETEGEGETKITYESMSEIANRAVSKGLNPKHFNFGPVKVDLNSGEYCIQVETFDKTANWNIKFK